jgi:uncharacterized membrane protein SpoIIM required for sporulation
VPLRVILPVGALFALLASLMAFLITYNEYARHFEDKRSARREALRTGLVTFLFFCVLIFIAGIILDRMLNARR